METKHTPGPWYVESDRTTVTLAGQSVIVAPAPDRSPRAEVEANAALIAASPDMLDALDRLTEAFPELGTDAPLNGADAVDRLAELWPVIQAARARARGT